MMRNGTHSIIEWTAEDRDVWKILKEED